MTSEGATQGQSFGILRDREHLDLLALFALFPRGTQLSFLLARNLYSGHLHKRVQIAKYQSDQVKW